MLDDFKLAENPLQTCYHHHRNEKHGDITDDSEVL